MAFERLEERRMLAGELDPTFGVGGKVVADFGRTMTVAGAAQQADGRIVVATHGFELVRYNTDGSLDTSFDGDGVVTPASLPARARAEAVAVYQDSASPHFGKIIVAGTSRVDPRTSATLYPEVTLMRYNADGTLDDGTAADSTPGDRFGAANDPTAPGGDPAKPFSAPGIVTFPTHGHSMDIGGQAVGKAVTIDSAGRIVVGVTSLNGITVFQSVIRFLPDGKPDPSFGVAGQLNFNFVLFSEEITGLLLQSDGAHPEQKIVVSGTGYRDTFGRAFALARIDPLGGIAGRGGLDPSFGSGGIVTTDFTSTTGTSPQYHDAWGGNAALAPDGDIVVAGGVKPVTSPVSHWGAAAARYTHNESLVQDGTLSGSFGGTRFPGRVVHELRPNDAVGRTIVVQRNTGLGAEKFFIGGIMTTPPTADRPGTDFCILGLNADGQPDVNFGAGGWVVTDFGTPQAGSSDDIHTLLLSSQGDTITAVGNVRLQGGPRSFGIARYLIGNPDGDDDGVLDVIEDDHPTKLPGSTSGDGNSDRIRDADQSNVASLPSAVDGAYLTVVTQGSFRAMRAMAPVDAPPLLGVTAPVGAFSFRVALGVASANIEFFLPTGISADSFFQFGATPDDPVPHWNQIPVLPPMNGGVFRVNLVDGGLGDGDGVVNGVITVLGAPVVLDGTPPSIRGFVFHDLDRDRQRDSFPFDPTLAGFEIYLDLNRNGAHEPSEPWSLTDRRGNYAFFDDDSLAPGEFKHDPADGGLHTRVNLQRQSYLVAEDLPEGWVNTLPPPYQTFDLAGGVPRSVAQGDLDGDGDLDLVAVATPDDPIGDVFTFLNQGDGRLTAGPSFLAFDVDSALVEDVNGDGRNDVVLAHSPRSIDDLTTFLADGKGGFTRLRTAGVLPSENSEHAMAAGYFDADGHLDLVVGALHRPDESSRRELGQIVLLKGLGNGSFVDPRTITFERPVRALASGDFDRDGKRDDVLAFMRSESGADRPVRFMFGDSLGNFRLGEEFTGDMTWFGHFNASVDSWPDLVTVDVDPNTFLFTGAVQFWFGAATGSFNAGPIVSVPPGSLRILTADFGGDGRDDLAFRHRTTHPYDTTLVKSNGDGTFTVSREPIRSVPPASVPRVTGSFLYQEASGFFDNDYIPDRIDAASPSGLAAYLSTRPAHEYARLGNNPQAELLFGNYSLFLGALSGTIILDVNGNRSGDLEELPAPGVRVVLDQNANGQYDPGIDREAVSNAEGRYSFTGVPPGDYRILMTTPAGHELTFSPPAAFGLQLAKDQIVEGQDFGIRIIPGTIRGTVWHDVNGDGKHDNDELGMTSATVFLDLNADGDLDRPGEPVAETDENGIYQFTELPTGRSYDVRLLPHTGFAQVYPDPLISFGHRVDLAPGGTVVANFGLVRAGTVEGTIFVDRDLDGLFDMGEHRFPNTEVWVDVNRNGVLDLGEPRTLTGANGSYTLTGVPPGRQLVAAQTASTFTEPDTVAFGFSVAALGRQIAVGDPSGGRGSVTVLDAFTNARPFPRILGREPQPYNHNLSRDALIALAIRLQTLGTIPNTTDFLGLRPPVPDTLGFAVTAIPGAIVGSSLGDGVGYAKAWYSTTGTENQFDPVGQSLYPLGHLVAPVQIGTTNPLQGIVVANADGAIDVRYPTLDDGSSRLGPRLNVGHPIESIAPFGPDRVVLGSPEAVEGAVAYLYDIAGSAILRTYRGRSPQSLTSFGSAVAAVGNDIIIGAPGEEEGPGAAVDSGAVYVFDADDGDTPRYRLANPAPAANDHFGFAVASSGEFVVVGAPHDDARGTDAGAVYVFDRATGRLLRTVYSPAPAAGAYFGFSLAPFGADQFLVGSPALHTADPGAVYLLSVGAPVTVTSGGAMNGINFSVPAVDHDADGIPDITEAAAPNGGDGDQDTVPDRQQSHVASFINSAGSYVTLVSPPGARLVAVATQTGGGPGIANPQGYDFPAGVYLFTVEGVPQGQPAEVEMIFHTQIEATNYFKFVSGAWLAFDNPIGEGATLIDDNNDGLINRAVLRLRDGAASDGDQQANGRIVDPGGPAFRSPPRVASVVINDGHLQRSKINSITVTFDSLVSIDPGAFELLRQGTNAPIGVVVALREENARTAAVLTFGGNGITGGSLFDGRYTLLIRGDRIRSASGQSLDGDGDGIAGGNRRDEFFRRFGDSDGDGDLDRFDAQRFQSTFRRRRGDSRYLWYLDIEDDGKVSLIDLLAFTVASIVR
jgi:uncharacterized delta-60 repeat protein